MPARLPRGLPVAQISHLFGKWRQFFGVPGTCPMSSQLLPTGMIRELKQPKSLSHRHEAGAMDPQTGIEFQQQLAPDLSLRIQQSLEMERVIASSWNRYTIVYRSTAFDIG